MKKLLLSFLILLGFVSSELMAQEYQSAVGIRAGFPWAASYKTFISNEAAIEVVAGITNYSASSALQVSGAYQKHADLLDVTGLEWYFGAGASVGIWSYDAGHTGSEGKTSIGVQGYVGTSYTFSDFPINLTLDFVPNLNIFGGKRFTPLFGLGIRYVFAR